MSGSEETEPNVTRFRPVNGNKRQPKPRLRSLRYPCWLRPNSPAAYPFTVLSVVLATLIRSGIAAFLNDDMVRFTPYFPAIVLTTFIGGVRGGLLAVLTSVICAWLTFMRPYERLGGPLLSDMVFSGELQAVLLLS